MSGSGLLQGNGLCGTDALQAIEPQLSDNSLRVLRARYLKKDESGNCTEAPTDLFRRVARAISEAELLYNECPTARQEWERRFYALMVERRFMPNSPTLMNAGREMGMLSACFVLPVRDSIHEIFDSIKYTALIQKAGGGTGFAFDELRPTGDYISTSGGTTSGPISFWRAFSEATNAIQQGAFRRGANMGMMYIHHPDILKFLHAKQDLTQFTNYNISIKVTDEWMEAFLRDPDGVHLVVNPRTKRRYVLPKALVIWEYDLRTLIEVAADDATPQGEFYTRRDIWSLITHNAHKTGEPGVVFMDRINEDNPTPHIGRIEATNPCGEQPLLPFEACNLGSINLAVFVQESPDLGAIVDWEALRCTIHECTRFLDNVIDVNRYPLPQIDHICKANRKIGLGVMGFADALYKLGVAYNSEEGVQWGRLFMKFVDEESHNYSEQLAHERGSFPNWEGSIYDTQQHRPMRNATCTTVAPTGTISIIAGCSGGIEPLYSLAFYRNVLRGQKEGAAPMVETNPIFEEVARNQGFFSEGLMERIATDGTLAFSAEVPAEMRKVFVCAHDVSPEWHMRQQAAFQEYCDASISKTINFSETATVDDVEKIYRMAYDMGCKGVTVYRNGCRQHQPMALKGSDAAHERISAAESVGALAKQPFQSLEPAVLPELTSGIRVRQLTPFGNMHINITVDPKTEREMEVFAQLGKGGDLANSDLEAICRMISLWLRSGGSLDHVIRQLHSIGSNLQVQTKEGKIMSLGDGLARALQKYTRAKTEFGLRSLLLGEQSVETAATELARVESLSRNGVKNGVKTNGAAVGKGQENGLAQSRTGDSFMNGHASLPSEELVGGPSGTLEAKSVNWNVRLDSMDSQWQQMQYKVVCPDCRGPLRFGEGCVMCEVCGFSKCG